MLSQPEFPKFADDVVLFCHITTKVESDPYQGLLQEKGGNGFPYLVFLDEKGDVVALQGSRNLEAFQSTAASVREYRVLAEKAKSGDAEARTALFFCRMDLGQLSLDEARKESKKLKDLTEEQKERMESSLLNLDVKENYVDPAGNTSTATKLGERWYAIARKGQQPSLTWERKLFWDLIEFYGEKKNNKAACKLAADARSSQEE